MLIPFDGTLNLAATLESGQAFRWRRGEESTADDPPWFYGVLYNNAVKIRQSADGVEFFCSPGDEATLRPLIRDYLRLDDDLDEIYQSIGLDDHMRKPIADYTGLRILRQEPWECLISFICSANSNIRRIATNVEDMSNQTARTVEIDGHVRSLFPTPDELAEVGETMLREMRLGFRAKYVAQVATTIAEGKLDLFALREAPYQEALDALVELPGVGDKVANCVMLFSLDKLESFPVDVWIRRALEEWYSDRIGSTPQKDIRAWAQGYFGRYAGYANQYMFHGRRLQGRTSSDRSS